MSPGFYESDVEGAALLWLGELGWEIRHEPELEPEEPRDERVVLEDRLREALDRLNPDLPADARDDSFRKLLRLEGSALLERNQVVAGELLRELAGTLVLEDDEVADEVEEGGHRRSSRRAGGTRR